MQHSRSLLTLSALALFLATTSLPSMAEDEAATDEVTVEDGSDAGGGDEGVGAGGEDPVVTLEDMDPQIYQSAAPEVIRNNVGGAGRSNNDVVTYSGGNSDLVFMKKKTRKMKPLFGPNSVFGDGSK